MVLKPQVCWFSGDAEQVVEKGRELLALYRQARVLAAEKVYNVEEVARKYASQKKNKQWVAALNSFVFIFLLYVTTFVILNLSCVWFSTRGKD